MAGALEKMLGEVETVMARIAKVVENVEALTGELRGQLGPTLEATQVALKETSTSLKTLSDSGSVALQKIAKTLDEIEAEISREDPARKERTEKLWRHIDGLLGSVVWLLGLGTLILLATAVFFLHHKLTSSRRHARYARRMGLLDNSEQVEP